MITTTLAVVALAGALSPNASPTIPGWQTDYAQARSTALAERKPLAVYVGQGAQALNRKLADGTISTDAAQLLRASYVCVYLDAETDAARQLTGRFELNEGLILNSPEGDVLAVRHGGAVSGADLTRQLREYSSGTPAAVVLTSATVATPAPVVTTAVIAAPATQTIVTAGAYSAPVMISGGCANGSCRTFAPTTGYVMPASGYQTYPLVSGGCANGRCPSPR